MELLAIGPMPPPTEEYNRTLAGIILEASDVYGNKTTMIMPTEMVNHNMQLLYHFKDCNK